MEKNLHQLLLVAKPIGIQALTQVAQALTCAASSVSILVRNGLKKL